MKRKSLVAFLLALGLVLSGSVAQATPVSPPVDFDALLDGLDELLGGVLNDGTHDLWNDGNPPTIDPLWQLVATQQGPEFVNADNDDNGIDDDDHLSMLEAILNESSCLDNFDAGRITSAQAAWGGNLQFVDSIQITLNNVNVTATAFSITFGDTLTITTGSTAYINPPAAVCWFTDCPIELDVPPLFGAGGLLDSADPALEDALANLIAAYMTLGDDEGIVYLDDFMGQVTNAFLQFLLPILLADLKTIPGDKSIDCADVSGIVVNDLDVDLDGIAVTLDVSVSSGNICNAINGLLANLSCGGSTFNCQTATFDADSDANEDGTINRTSYQVDASSDRDTWLDQESVDYPVPAIGVQPVGNIAPDPVVALGPAGFWSMDVVVSDINGESYEYQWYSDETGSMQPLTGATSDELLLGPLGYVGDRQFRVDVTDPCHSKALTQSTTVTLRSDPPDITITAGPAGGSVAYGGNFLSLDANATIDEIPPTALSCQWWFDNGGGGGFVAVGTAAAPSHSYDITGATYAHAGDYKCIVTSVAYGHSEETATATVTVTPPNPVVDVQPVGQSLILDDPLLLSCAASMPDGSGVTLQWEFDDMGGSGYGNVGSSGVSPLAYSQGNAQFTDAGNYRCLVTSDDFPANTTYSAVVFVSVVGAAYRVDMMRPAGPPEDGLSWDTAFLTLQAAIDAAELASGGEVWVAGGPEPGSYVYDEQRTQLWGTPPHDGSLVLKDNVQLYGGFEGFHGRQEVTRSQRGVRRAVTTISGVGTRLSGAADAFHVVAIGKEIEPVIGARLDGFTITGGNASGDGVGHHTYRGGGIYNWASSPIIANCTITGNSAAVSGGGISNETDVAGNGGPETGNEASARIENCVIWANTANRAIDATNNPIRGGGGICNTYAEPDMIYLTVFENILGNPAYTDFGATGGGIYSWDSDTSPAPGLNSSIVWLNDQGDILDEGLLMAGAPVYTTNVNYTDSAPVWPGGGSGNISLAPGFASFGPEFFLDPSGPSPCIDAGDPASPAPANDLPGSPRPQPLGPVDMGAYEYVANLPDAQCNAVTVELDATGNGALVIGDVDNGSTADGGIWKMVIGAGLDSIPYDCSDVAAGDTVTLTVTDYQGGVGTCDATITVEDNIAPTALCANVTVQLDASGAYTLDPETDLDNGSSDICGIDWAASTANPPTVDCTDINDPPSPITVILTVRDVNNNAAVCSANVTVQDLIAPAAFCQAYTVELDAAGQGTLTGADIDGGSTDNTDGECALSLDILPTAPLFNCADIAASPHSVTLTVTDAAGNTATCDAQVTVEDNEDPVMACQDLTIQLDDTGNASIVAQQLDDGTTDCAIASYAATQTAFTCADIDAGFGGSGPVVVTLTVTDDYANSATCDATVTVQDVTPAVITLTGDAEMTIQNGDPYTEQGATTADACDGSGAALESGTVNTSLDGDYTVNYDYTDASGNVSVQVQRTVHVISDLPPEITVLGSLDVTVDCKDTYEDDGATAWDPEDLDLTGDIDTTNPVDTDVPGDYTVIYDVEDSFGNTDTKTRTVHVVDTEPPTLTLSGDALMYVPLNGTYTEPYGAAIDFCQGNLTLFIEIGGAVNTSVANTYNLTYDVKDSSDNWAIQATRTVIVYDAEDLAISYQPQDRGAYIDDTPFLLTAEYSGGYLVDTFEWFRGFEGGAATGLGSSSVPMVGNTLELTVDPSGLSVGTYQYRVDVTDLLGTVSSEDADVEIANHMASAGLEDDTVTDGADYSMTVVVTGGLGDLNYAWFRDIDGSKAMVPVAVPNISGEDTDTLSFTPFNAADAGVYEVQVSDDNETLSPAPSATLTVGTGVPATSLFGLAALAALTALGGVAGFRRKK